ncbi:MAG: penicillin-binding transpeptidase domain-containing protein [Candidatus Omnitrophota bacterium]
MKRNFWIFVVVCIAVFCGMTSAFSETAVEIKDFGKYFEGFNTATFVMYDESGDKYVIFNEPQSTKSLSPCSTFKIYNALAGLEDGVLDRDDARTLVKWDGTRYDFPAWNKDQTLSSAIKDSVVWYFKALAAQIGEHRMQAFLDKIGYGNRDISGGLTKFWLGSSIKISAREQVDILHRLYTGQLPLQPENVRVVIRDITLSDEQGVRFMGKTGSGFEDGKWILGWFVGCVEKEGKRYYFATNIEAADEAKGPKAKEITKMILKDLNIL